VGGFWRTNGSMLADLLSELRSESGSGSGSTAGQAPELDDAWKGSVLPIACSLRTVTRAVADSMGAGSIRASSSLDSGCAHALLQPAITGLVGAGIS